MLRIWWPAYLVPVLMLLGCMIPWLHYVSPSGTLSREKQQFADHQFHQILWRFGLAFAALSFMTMQSVRLLPLTGQRWLAFGILILQAIADLLMVIPIEKAIAQQFGENPTDKEGDTT